MVVCATLLILIVFVGVSTPAAPASHPTPSEDGNRTHDGQLNSTDYPQKHATGVSTQNTQIAPETRVNRILRVTRVSAVNTDVFEQVNATIVDRYDRLYRISIPRKHTEQLESRSWVVDLSRPVQGRPAVVSEGVGMIAGDAAHARNITGQGISVGILSCQGFNTSSPELAGHINATQSYHPAGLDNSGQNDHGTAIAAIVADVAPDAELHLVNHGPGHLDYQRSVDWLRAQNVDIITNACGYPLQPDDGTGFFSQQLDLAALTDDIASFVAAGNSARSHYQAPFNDTDGDGWHNVRGEREATNITDRSDADSYLEAGEQIFLEVQWDDWNETNVNIDIAIRDRMSGEVVAVSGPVQDGNDPPYDLLQYEIPERGRYSVAIYSTDVPNGTVVEAELLSEEHVFTRPVAIGSVGAPATGDQVAGIAAFDRLSGNRPDYSSAGPTDDNELGISVSGPTNVQTGVYPRFFEGTSASAPHAAGVAALVLQAKPNLTSDGLYHAIQSGADDIGPSGPDLYTGYGLLNTTGSLSAVNALSDPSPDALDLRIRPPNSTVPTGQTQTHEIVATNATNGVGLYDITVETSNVSALSIVDGRDAIGGVNVTAIAEDNSSIDIGAVGGDTNQSGNVTLAAVTIRGENPGKATLTVTEQGIGNEDSEPYAATPAQPTTVVIRSNLDAPDVIGNGKLATDVDNDGLYEDIDGDGTFDIFDVQALLTNRGSAAVQSQRAKFDFTGDGAFDIFDIQALLDTLTAS